MKRQTLKSPIVVLAVLLASMSAMALKKDPNYLKARRNGAKAQIKVCVVDECGVAVSNARIGYLWA